MDIIVPSSAREKAERVIHAPTNATDLDVSAAEAMAHKFIVYPVQVPPQYPYWSECIAVEDRTTYEWLGLVGKLGMSHTWEYTNLLPNKRGHGRVRSREEAVLALAKVAGVTGF